MKSNNQAVVGLLLLFRLKHEKDLIVNMKYEKERLDTVCEQEAKQIEKLAKVLEIVES